MRNLHLLTQTFSQDGQLSGTHQINGVWPSHTSDQQALLWLAICRAYRFIREFAVEVTGWKIVLDRGLDILQAPIRREGFSLGVGDRLQEHRMTKFFYVTYVREEKHA